MMPQAPAIVSVPAIKAHRCWQHSPKTNLPCTRATSHTGRHHFAWTHLDGRVREVWTSDCQICGRPTIDGAVCKECGS